MHPSTRGTTTASSLLTALVVAAVLVTGCDATASPSAAPAATPTPALTAPASPGLSTPASPRLPTPVPTVLSSPPTAAPSEPAPTGALVLRLTTCDDVCSNVPGTTILDDGRIIWQQLEDRVLEARLTPEGLAKVRAAIDGTPQLAADGIFVATLRPGAEPIPHGIATHTFKVARPTGTVTVDSWDPNSLDDQLESWVISPDLEVLDDLAESLTDPVEWLGQASFASLPEAFSPDRYMIVIDLFPDIGEAGEFPADVDDIDWPFGRPIESAGEAVGPAEGGPPARCLILSAAEAQEMRAAELEAGSGRNLRAWVTTRAYDWRRADGFVQVNAIQLLPHERGTCGELFVPGV